MPIDETVLYTIFHILLSISTFSTIIVFFIYYRMKRNRLIPWCAVTLFITFTIIYIGIFALNIHEEGDFTHKACMVQGLVLNYLFTVIHALVAFMMVDNCLYALNWKVASSEGEVGFPWFYFVASFLVPLAPNIAIVVMYFQSGNNEWLKIRSTGYHCYLMTPIWSNSAPFAVYSLLGIAASIVLLKRTIWGKNRLRVLGSSTQLTKKVIGRLLFITFMYSFICLASFLPHMLNDFLRNGSTFDADSSGHVIVKCSGTPKWHNFTGFIPCFVGIQFFIMYGTSTYAMQYYHRMYWKVRKQWGIKAPDKKTGKSIVISRRKNSVLEEIVFHADNENEKHINMTVIKRKGSQGEIVPPDDIEVTYNLDSIEAIIKQHGLDRPPSILTIRQTFNEDCELDPESLEQTRKKLRTTKSVADIDTVVENSVGELYEKICNLKTDTSSDLSIPLFLRKNHENSFSASYSALKNSSQSLYNVKQ